MITKLRNVACLAVAMFGVHSPAAATPIHVSPKADVYLAGGNVRADSVGESPSDYAFTNVPGLEFTFDVTGTASPFGAGTAQLGPDGNLGDLGGLGTIDKLSGITYPGLGSLPLFGVFLGDSLPASAPSGLAFYTTGVAFNTLQPLLGQVFWIGDGLTGTGAGSAQVFSVPTGATHLYFGVIDDGGRYLDNVGGFDVTITAQSPDIDPAPVPEPATLLMLSTGAALVASRRRTQLRS